MARIQGHSVVAIESKPVVLIAINLQTFRDVYVFVEAFELSRASKPRPAVPHRSAGNVVARLGDQSDETTRKDDDE
jgi:hypothetical protein